MTDEMKVRIKLALKKLSKAIEEIRIRFHTLNTSDPEREELKGKMNSLKEKFNKFYAQLHEGKIHYTSVAKGNPMAKKISVHISPSIALSAAANPYLMADGLVDIDKIKAAAAKLDKKYKESEEAKAIGFYLVPRRVKPVKYSAAKAKAKDVKYLTTRAAKLVFRKRLTDAALVRNVVMFTVYENTAAADSKIIRSVVSACNAHLKKSEGVKTTVTKEKDKIRTANEKEFNLALGDLRDLLENVKEGYADANMVESSGMMGKTILLKVGKNTVVSIGRSDMAKFRAAKKAASSAE